jgi:diacylglycerol kinase family enzyme
MKRAILVHNPTAGQGKHSAEELTALLRAAGFGVRYVHAKKKRQVKALCDAKGLIVVAGGDGTVHRVARRLAGHGKTMTILPLGTANNIARSLGIQGTPAELVPRLKRAKEIAIDLGVARGPWGKRVFVEGVGGGLFAEVMAKLDSGRARRRKRPAAGNGNDKTLFSKNEAHLMPSLHALAEHLQGFRAKAFEVTIDGVNISGDFLLLEAMNMPYLGPNLHLGRDADPADGKLDFVLLSEERRGEFAEYIRHRLEGGTDAPNLTAMKGKRLHCVWRGSKLHIDDKIALTGNAKRPPAIEVEVMPRAVRLLIPRVKGASGKPGNGGGKRTLPLPRRRVRRVQRIKHAG